MKTTSSEALDIIIGIPPINLACEEMSAKLQPDYYQLNLGNQETMDTSQS